MGIRQCGIRVVLASVMLAVAFVLLLAPAALAEPSAAPTDVASTWSPLPSSLTEASTTARAAARPAILRLSLTAAKPGARLTITGSGFGARRGKGNVLFGVFKATSYVRWSARKIVCRVPMIPSGRLTLKVRTAGGTSSGKRFTVKALPTVVPETTDVLTEATLAGASTTDGATYAFTDASETSALAPGDVIVGEPTAALPDGLLRKVTAVTDGGKVVLTEPAYLEEAITSGEIVAGHSFSDDDLASAGSLPRGVELVSSRQTAGGDLLTFRLKGASATINGSFNNGIGPVNVSGTVTLRISTKFSCKLSGAKLRSFSCGATTTESSDLRVVVGSNQNYSGGLSVPLMTKVEGFWVGHVPVVIKWGVSLKLGADVEYREGVSAVTHQNVFGSFGLDYQAGLFTKRAVLTTSATSEQPLLARNGSVKGRVGPEVDVRLYGVVGPAVGFDGYLKAEADDLNRPNWRLLAGLEVNASFGAGIQKSIFDIGTSWASDTWTIKEWVLRKGVLDAEPTPTPTPSSTPTPGSGDWAAVSAGDQRSLALKTDGTLWAWGWNSDGALGVGDRVDRWTPTQVGSERDWRRVSAGYYHSLALKTNGTLWAWGPDDGSLGLGDFIDANYILSPTQVGSAADWAAVSGGLNYSLALKRDGTLWAWGQNWSGQLGLGDQTDRLVPTQVGSASDWATVTAGLGSTLALKTDGSLWAWGGNRSGQLGLGDTVNRWTPTRVDNASDWASLLTGLGSNMALKSDGTLWAWGYNGHGELGLGDTADRWTPTQVAGGGDWVAASAGIEHSVGLRRDGTVWTWGHNGNGGQLGLGDTTDRLVPTQIAGAGWATIFAGFAHNLALKTDGSLWVWGANWTGELGLGDTADRWTPTLLGNELP